MNGRLYDPVLGRMLSPDNNVQMPDFTQNYNRYSYVLNNPLRYSDPSGEFVVAPILIGMAWGAAIGAGVSAAIYSTTALATGQNWTWSGFGKSAFFGAVGGAISGGLGAYGATLGGFGQSLSYNILSSVAGNSATTLAFGGKISAGGLVGMVAGGVLGYGIGNFNAVSGGALKNVVAETAFLSGKGAITGGVGGAIGAGIDGNDIGNGFLQGAKYGAIAGATMSLLNNAIMGAAYQPNSAMGELGANGAVFRRGHFLYKKGDGLTLGRNLITRLTGDATYDKHLQAHEAGHYFQQSKLGFAGFYSRTLREYARHGQMTTYETGGTLEFGAQIFSLNKVGYFYSNKFGLINANNYNDHYNNAPQKYY